MKPNSLYEYIEYTSIAVWSGPDDNDTLDCFKLGTITKNHLFIVLEIPERQKYRGIRQIKILHKNAVGWLDVQCKFRSGDITDDRFNLVE